MPEISPIRFQPVYQTRVWGGRRLETVFGRNLPDAQPYGESWELCDRPAAQSIVINGVNAGKTLHELWTQQRSEIFGKRHLGHPAKRFPILLKILDCADVLSLQVHPPREIAPQFGGEPKTEMWFVAHADAGAKIYAGLRNGVTRAQFESALENGTVASLIHEVRPRPGEFMFVESGRIHALGAGLLVFEIQQNSDTTYRVFDWNRTGLDGRPRELHVNESLASIDFDDFEPAMQSAAADGTLACCEFFHTRLVTIPAGDSSELRGAPDDFACVAIVEGSGRIGEHAVRAGDFLIIPANCPGQIHADSMCGLKWLEITLPVSGKP